MTTGKINGEAFRELIRKHEKIKKIADAHHEERYDTDWDSMQEALMKIWKLTK